MLTATSPEIQAFLAAWHEAGREEFDSGRERGICVPS